METIQVIDKREVPALSTRCFALDLLCKLKGIYAPKQIDFDPAARAALVTVNMNVMEMSRDIVKLAHSLNIRPVKLVEPIR